MNAVVPSLTYAVSDKWPVTEIARTFGMTRRRATKLVKELGGAPWSKAAGGSLSQSMRRAS